MPRTSLPSSTACARHGVSCRHDNYPPQSILDSPHLCPLFGRGHRQSRLDHVPARTALGLWRTASICLHIRTALTFLDPIAILFLVAKPRLGVALTAAIIGADVVVNGWVGVNYGIDTLAFAAQVAFLVFVAATVRTAWGRRRSGMGLANGETMTLGFPPRTRGQ